jgi:hypothetical protein
MSNASRIVTGFFALLPFRYRTRPASRQVKPERQIASIRKSCRLNTMRLESPKGIQIVYGSGMRA